MGEYAKRKSDGVEIKIGTCEDMYYLRYEDRGKVSKIPNSLDPSDCDGLRFRLPFPDEDNILPGQYEDYNRGLRLYQSVNAGTASAWHQDFTDESTMSDPGIIQLKHETSGLLLNVPCYHGHKLPEVTAPIQAFWNGKGHSLELSSIKAHRGDVLPVVGCRHCGGKWRYSWAEIWDFIPRDIRSRFEGYKLAAEFSALEPAKIAN